MNLNFLIKKNHIFKRRQRKVIAYNHDINLTSGIYSQNKIRFEFVYLRIFKKIFRKKYFKQKKLLLPAVKYWLMIKPNFILSMKSKNSRMGCGVGNYIRVCCIVKPSKPLILFKNYSDKFILNTKNYIKKKLNINTYIKFKNRL